MARDALDWPRWYVCVTNARQEAFARDNLRRAGYEVLFLHFQSIRSHARRETAVILPLYPRYLFVALEASQGFHGITTAQGVHSIITDGERPLEVPESIIEEQRQRGDENGLCILTPEEKKLRKRLQRGDRIQCQYDEFTIWLGTVILDSGPAVSMWKDGRKVTVPSHRVSPIGRSRAG